MAIDLNVSSMPFQIPWFMVDLDNKQLITSPYIPGDIKDNKAVIFSETPIPGRNFQPVNVGGGGNRKIGFTLPILSQNNTVGNILLVKQFENLRNRAPSFLSLFSEQFQRNPQVLYYWGTGSIPLVYYVTKCSMSTKEGWVNELGNPKLTYVEIELLLDETSILYKAEEVYRLVASLLGMVQGVASIL